MSTESGLGVTAPAGGREATIGRIMRARRRMSRLLLFDRANPLLTANLTMSQLRLLLELAWRDGAGGHDLAVATGVSLATITGIVDRLAAQGLVSRREDPHDRRIRRIELTPAGQALIEDVISAGSSRQRRVLDRLDPAGLAIVEQAFDLMIDAIDAERAEHDESASS